jgi:hypothetical protein
MTRPAHWCGSEMQTSYQRPFMACSTEVSLVALYRLPIIFWHPSQTRHKKQQEKYPRCSPIRDGISGRVSYKERVVYSVEPRHCYTSHLLFIPVTQMNSPRSMSDNPSLFVPACAQWIVHEIGCHTCEIVNSPCSGGTGRSDDATCGLLSVRNCSPVTVWPLESTSGHTHERPCCA